MSDRMFEILTGRKKEPPQPTASFDDPDFLEKALVFMIDSISGGYEVQLANMKGKKKQVFVALLEFARPVRVKEIAEATGLSSNKVSAYLGRLAHYDVRDVRMVPQGGRTLYEAADRHGYYPCGRAGVEVWYQLKHHREEAIKRYVAIAEAGDVPEMPSDAEAFKR